MPIRNRHKAFTMLELLVVISIILVLLGLATIGFKHVTASGKSNATKTAMETGRNMINELQVAMGKRGLSSRQPIGMWSEVVGSPGTPNFNTPQTANGMDIWRMADPSPNNVSLPLQIPYSNTGSTNYSNVTDDSAATRCQTAAIRNSVMVMSVLMTMPNNKQIRSKIPADKLFTISPWPDNSWSPVTNINANFNATQYPLLKDGWGNPMIFVPANGLRVLIKGGAGTYNLADATQQYIIISPEGQVTGNGTATPMVTRPGRPFWASAGPDGDFTQGDDNLYSFEN